MLIIMAAHLLKMHRPMQNSQKLKDHGLPATADILSMIEIHEVKRLQEHASSADMKQHALPMAAG